MKREIVVVVATHKKYDMPKNDLYMPLEVGVDIHGKNTNFVGDNSGDNISNKNAGFCELSGLYWVWKNLKTNYAGLAHYRRHFMGSQFIIGDKKRRMEKILTKKQALKILETNDVILPKKRNYLIENLYDHYVHTMQAKPLEMTGEIIKEKYPKYYAEFERLKDRKTAHMFNMMIMRKDILDRYAEWLFDILFTLEKEVGKSELEFDDFHARFYGRISELLLDVYINTESIPYTEIKVSSMEPVNWIKKGGSFVGAKFLGRKYHESF